MKKEDPSVDRLMRAISFAARAHQGQLRKDGKTPYAAHVFRVAMTLTQVFGVRDHEVLTAAVLHDTIEDTTTDYDAVEAVFGKRVAGWVARLSKDTRLPDALSEKAYCETLKRSPAEVKLIKLADIFDNLCDSDTAHKDHRSKSKKRARFYLQCLKPDAAPEVRAGIRLVEQKLARI